ncbi:MAG TPA: phosphate regulon sensor histidine kinase PhoR, partial [Quisquiliibacterium sp.]|nr:phosphate regulon sensor histidine kinase PhoR [Quisquiliibacterium sp.]
MNLSLWLAVRALLLAVCGGAGAFFGRRYIDHPDGWIHGAAIGLAALSVTLLLFDTLRMRALARWLVTDTARPAPVHTGPLAELGYRIDRALKAREAMTASEQDRIAQFLSAIEASPNGVLLLNAADRIQWMNRVSAEHFGLDPQRDLEQSITNLVRAPAFVTMMRAGQHREPIVIPVPGGRSLSVQLRPYGDGMKLLLSQDITERERNESMRREFVANVSHELRSPLTVLMGFIETLSDVEMDAAERARIYALMSQQGQRMLSLVTDSLTLAQIEGSSRPRVDTWIDVGGLLERIGSDARAFDQGRHVVTVEAGPPARISGTESELYSAVWNLVSNALRYTPDGGAVSVRWRLEPGGRGEFSVTDTGIGIRREHLPRLTERFYRVDSGRSRETGGTGLGLSIVKHVAQRHGGELRVESEPGKGSTFTLVLPASRIDADAAPTAPPAPAPPAGSRPR